MTATRGTARTTGAKKKPAAKSTAKRSTAPRATATASRARKPPPPPTPFTVRALDALGAASRGHGADFAGIFLVVLGVVAGLGIYAGAGGPVGRATGELVGTLVGAARVVAPPLFAAVGALLIRGVPEPAPPPLDPEDPTRVESGRIQPGDDGLDHPLARFVLGSTLLGAAGLGLLHLIRDAPALGAGRDALADSAGYLGAVIGGPIEAALGTAGSAVVLSALAFAGALVVTRTTVAYVVSLTAAGVAAGARPVGHAMRRALGGLFELNADRDPDAVEQGAPPITEGPLLSLIHI